MIDKFAGMIPVSVVIITFNEERNIGRCIDSVQHVADEVVVVDSYSTDLTEQICKSKNVKFIRHPFAGHIEQKNFAITQAKYPHILSLDADEALDQTLIQSILAVKMDWRYDGYTMNRLTNYCGKWIYHCGWYADVKLRLWDSRKGKWGGINPHDKYVLTVPESKTKHLKGNILHYSYYSIEDHKKQAKYFSEIGARALFKKGKRGSLLKLIFSPVFKFVRDYIFNRGFMDGYYGFVICKISSWATYNKYKTLIQLSAGK